MNSKSGQNYITSLKSRMPLVKHVEISMLNHRRLKFGPYIIHSVAINEFPK